MATQPCGAQGDVGDEEVAEEIQRVLHAQGGSMQAHLVFTVAPELRRRLRDRRLLRFLEEWPEKFAVQRCDLSGGSSVVTVLGVAPAPAAPGGGRPQLGSRAMHTARMLAESIWFALEKYRVKQASEPEAAAWAPVPWLIRDKLVRQRLQAHALLSPRPELMHHREEAFVAALGESGALWAELIAYLVAFMREWPTEPGAGPELRENLDTHCKILCDQSDAARRLCASGYECPCRLEAAGREPNQGDAVDHEALGRLLVRRVLQVVSGGSMSATRVGADPGVQKWFRAARQEFIGKGGFVAWMQAQDALRMEQDHKGDWWVKPARPSPGAAGKPPDGRAAPKGGGAPRRKTASAGRRGQDSGSDSEGCTVSEGENDTWVRDLAWDAQHGVQVIAESLGVIAIAKPAGITTERLIGMLSRHLSSSGRDGLVTSVSRLDVMTSGVLVVALGAASSEGAEALTAQFRERRVAKEYMCLCRGANFGAPGFKGEVNCRLKLGKGQYRAYMSPQGKVAHTEFEVLANFALPRPAVDGAAAAHLDELRLPLATLARRGAARGREDEALTLLRVRPITGRTHQIRAHLASIGRPLVSDSKYSPRRARSELDWCPRMFLHCRRMELQDAGGAAFKAEVELPSELQAALATLRPWDPGEGSVTATL